MAIRFIIVFSLLVTAFAQVFDGYDEENFALEQTEQRGQQQQVSASGTIYTRWGRTDCPSGGAQLVYHGLAGGTFYSQAGGGNEYICMPHNPQYASAERPGACSYLYGTEYQSYHKIFQNMHDHNAPCAVCYVPFRSSQMMVPARTDCYSGWNKEYQGYLMAEYVGHGRSANYVCVDVQPQSVPGSIHNKDGALLYFITATCHHGLPCPPYDPAKAVTCAVCTR